MDTSRKVSCFEKKAYFLISWSLSALLKPFKTCPICSEEIAWSLCFRKDQCGHLVCMDCLVQHLDVQINEGNTSIYCPVACTELMLQHEIKKYVSRELFERYDRQGVSVLPEINRIYDRTKFLKNSSYDFNLSGPLDQCQIWYTVRSVTHLLKMAILPR